MGINLTGLNDAVLLYFAWRPGQARVRFIHCLISVSPSAGRFLSNEDFEGAS